MKKLLLIVAVNLAAASMVFGQSASQVNFQNGTAFVGHPAPVVDLDHGQVGAATTGLASDGLVGTTWVAQLFFASDAGNNSATAAVTGTPAPFRIPTTTQPGVWNGGKRDFVASVAAGTTVSLIVRVWNTAVGDYAANVAQNIGGQSDPFNYNVAAASNPPPTPNDMVNFQGFGVHTVIVPEPSVIALGVIGVGALLLRRRK